MPENPVRYERSDAQAGGIVAFAAGLLLLGLAIHLALAWLFDVFRAEVRLDDPPLPALAAAKRLRLPDDLSRIPPPVLQQNEIADLRRLREAEDRRLSSYGWVDAEAGTVRIPIAEAMRLLADPKVAERHGIRTEAVTKKKGGR